MTRKDYVATAKALAAQTIKDADWERLQAWIADAFAADNERFDREWFYAACEETAK